MSHRIRPISMIVAMAANRVIGKNNTMPWHLPADLKHFRSMTMGKPIVMGRKTHESIGIVLPGRLNLVLSGRQEYQPLQGAIKMNDLKELPLHVSENEEVFIIGGGALYRDLLPTATKIYLTVIEHEFEGDVFFPVLDDNEWTSSKVITTSYHDFPHKVSYKTLVRKSDKVIT